VSQVGYFAGATSLTGVVSTLVFSLLFIGFVNELMDDAGALSLLDPSLVHLSLFREEPVVDFPAH
jgi:hypothetical protein